MDIAELERVAIAALYKAHEAHEALGERGEEKIQKNQFGETALLVDVKAEEVVIEELRAARVPLRLISEEHGVVDIVEAPTLLGVLDGLDGSSVYLSQRGKGRYGTMLGIFSNLDPKYEDYLVSGVMIHSPQAELYFASKQHGSFVTVDGKRERITGSGATELQKASKIYVDVNFEINRELASNGLAGYDIRCAYSSAVHYTDVARGVVDAVLECTRKQNLEIAVAYGLVTEARGVMLTLDKVSLENRYYNVFSQDTYTPVVTAATLKLAHAIIAHVTSNNRESG